MIREDQPLGEGEDDAELDFATECILDGIDPDLLFIALLTHGVPGITVDVLDQMLEEMENEDEENFD